MRVMIQRVLPSDYSKSFVGNKTSPTAPPVTLSYDSFLRLMVRLRCGLCGRGVSVEGV